MITNVLEMSDDFAVRFENLLFLFRFFFIDAILNTYLKVLANAKIRFQNHPKTFEV